MPHPLLNLEPVTTLLSRAEEELSASFDFSRPIVIARAPGRLDVMGGIADYTGSLVCEMPIDRAAAVMAQRRADRAVQIFSFNLYDEHRPFTVRMSLDALAAASAESLRADLAAPGRQWAGYLIGCLFILHEKGLVDLADPSVPGVELALHSTVPLGAGLSSSAAIEVATMMALVELFGLKSEVKNPTYEISDLRLAALCQEVENRVVGAPCGIMDQAASAAGRAGTLMRMVCQPHELQPALDLPAGVRVVGVNSNVKHSVGGGAYGRTRCAAFMGHSMILDKMREMGEASGKTLAADPMGGYLANLDPDDYKAYFRPYLPESIAGGEFLDRFGPTIDAATTVDAATNYPVQAAADHHVLEARRVKQFAAFLEKAGTLDPAAEDYPKRRGTLLDKAGHLMYASHKSYGDKAGLGSVETDLLVKLAREREPAGLYGAKITGGGSGGTVAILADNSEKADAAIDELAAEYLRQTGIAADVIRGSSPGAWEVGTATVG